MSSSFQSRLGSGKRLVSLEFWVRVLGMFGFGYAGWWFGNRVSSDSPSPDEIRATLLLALSGAGLGLLITHRIIVDPIRDINRWLRATSAPDLLALSLGGLIGAVFGVMMTFPLSYLPGALGDYLPIISAALAIYLSALAVLGHKNELVAWAQQFTPAKRRSRQEMPNFGRACLLDTSAIIDGRISAVVRSGFLDSVLIVPRFVLNELQLLADSSDDMKRMRGRRGLDLLNEMQKDPLITIEITSDDVSGVRGVDQKLIGLAIQQNRALITNDKNLSQVAELQEIQVLNLNVLSDAVRPPAVAGDMMVVNIREEGREREQGIGYLDDGTMVVVEDARDRIGEDVRVVVSRVWANDRGRMVFGRIMGSAGAHHNSH
jgi:uncharacterized protein YacL